MALSRTTVHSQNSGAPSFGTGGFTTSSFTPPDSSLLVVAATAMEDGGTTDPSGDMTISGGSLTWTSRAVIGKAPTFSQGLRIWSAPVTTGASMTVTLDCGSRSIWRYVVSIVAYTGYDTGSPVGATATNGNPTVDGQVVLTLSGNPADGSEVLGALATDTAVSSTPGAGWTEIHDLQNLGDAGLQTQVRAATGSFVVASAAAALSTNDPAVTFTGYTPLENDIVVLFPSSTTVLGVVADASLPSGWSNPLGDGVEVNSDAHGIACLIHTVTAAEESGGTTTYTATNALDAAETGNVTGCVIRGSSGVDAANSTFNSGNTVTPHVLASLPGGSLSDGSQVISCVAKDGTGAYSTDPTGWTGLVTSNTNQGKWLGRRDALTTAGVDVSATNITPSAGDEYASVTLAFVITGSPTNDPTVTWADTDTGGTIVDDIVAAIEIKVSAGGTTVNGTGAGTYTFGSTAAGVPETFGTAIGAFTFGSAAAGIDRALGAAAGSYTFTGTASGIAGTPPVTGQATGAYTFTGVAAGTPETFGQAVTALGFTGTAAGVPRTSGAATGGYTFTSTAAGVDRALGAVNGSIGFGATAGGVPDVHGAAAGPYTFTGTANGFAGTPPVTGIGQGTYTFGSVAAGIDRTLGAAATGLTFSSTATGIPDVQGTAVAPFTVGATAIGDRKTFAQAAASLAFSAAGSAFVGEIPVPSGHPVLAARRIYSVTVDEHMNEVEARP